MVKCLICNLECTNRQQFAYHLNHTHNINTSDYKIQYKPDKDANLLECPICGKYNMKQLTQHITDIHKLTKEEFLTQYPNTKLWIEEVSERCSKAQSIGIQVYRDNIANDPHYYDDVYAERSKKRNYTEIADRIRKTRIERGTNEKMSERVKKMWENPEYRQMQSEKTKEQHRNGLTDIVIQKSGKKRFKIILDDVTYNMRSIWETKVANSLYKRNIKFKYEPFAIKYNFNNETKLYYPDFYLEDYNLIVEVKPLELCNSDMVVAKKNACIKQGYKFMFITEKELSYLNTIIYE